jgi:HAD superfamily hydrolase (TIGR01509 family)
MTQKITALVFDCFGVLTTDGWLPYAQKYFGDKPALLQQARDLNKRVDSGLVDYNSFVQAVADLAGVAFDDAYKQIQNNITNQQLFDYIQQLKPTYKIGVLSNAGKNWLNVLFTPQQNALFDAVVLSCDIGTVKPDPLMYTTMCERLGVQPQQAVFVDDIERYAAGANQVGMQSLVYKDFEQLRAQLDALQATN